MTQEVFTGSSGSWTVPDGVTTLKVTLIGAGGGGGGSAKLGSKQVNEGGGGGGGACTQFTMNVTPGQSISYSVGSGGLGGNGAKGTGSSVAGINGRDGDKTTFGSYYVNGGKGGIRGYTTVNGGVDGDGGAGGSGGSSPSTIFSGGAGGAGGKDGSGYGYGGSVLNAGGGGGGIGDSTIYNYATNAGYPPHTDSSANASAQEGGKPGHYGTGGGGDSGFDGSNYGVGGKGGNGLIILEYYVIEEYTVTINATNGTISTSENGTYTQSLSIKVPKTGVIYGVSSNNQMCFVYNNSILYTIYAKPNKGYDVPSWSPSSGDVTSSFTMTVTFSSKSYSCRIGLGVNYASFVIYKPSQYSGTYTSDKVIEHLGGEELDVDWRGATSETSYGAYQKRRTEYSNTNIEKLVYGSTVDESGDGKVLPAQSCDVYPSPQTAGITSETDYYRCQVSFDANGGSGVPSPRVSDWSTSSSSIYVSWDSTVPTKSGFSFRGWARTSNATSPEFTGTSGNFPSGAITLYAVWGAESYTVSLAADPSDGGTVSGAGSYSYGSSVTIKAIPADNHLFVRWSDGSQQAVRTISITRDYSLTATFRRKTYTVRFYANDGTTNKKEQTMGVGVSSPLIANTWERDQYTFIGWATSSDGAVEYGDGETVTDLSTEDGAVVSLYAVWQHIEPSNPGVMQFKRWDGSANEHFTHGDMKRIEDAVNKLLSCIQMPTVTFNTPPSAGSPLDYRDMATIESKTSKMATVRGLTISAFTEWYVGYMLTFADIERIESNLYAIYQNFGGTTPRTDA